jgi:lysophospholipase L1-like esterase
MIALPTLLATTLVAPPIQDPTGLALAEFYEALRDSEQDHAKTRVLHMGDSTIAVDGVPHAIRRRLQKRFGDGGAGFVAMTLAGISLRNQMAEVEGTGWQTCYISRLCRKDGLYGLGGYVHTARADAWSKIATRRGRNASMIELWYAALPGGGEMEVRVDNGDWEVVATDGAPGDRWFRVDLEEGTHSMEVRPMGPGTVQTYGWVVESDEPGVVWDTVSMWGAYTKRVEGFDAQHIVSQVGHRDPDLLVLNYGGNDMRRLASGAVDKDGYKKELRAVLRKLRAAKPTMPCLVASVVDHIRSGSTKVQPEDVLQMVAAQREAAFEERCAFFNSVTAMGGPGGLQRWAERDLVADDLVHLNPQGRDLMGQMMYVAMMRGYDGYLARMGDDALRYPDVSD